MLRKGTALRDFDDLVRDTLDSEMLRSGITILRDTGGLAGIEIAEDGSKTVVLKEGGVKSVTGVDQVVMATGRAPLVKPLNLEEAGVAQQKSGKIEVDEYSRTSRADVFAVGDVSSNVELTPMAIAAGRRLADRLFGGEPEAKVSYDMVPTVVFSHPPIGVCGMTEKQAREKFGDAEVKVYTSKVRAERKGANAQFTAPFVNPPLLSSSRTCGTAYSTWRSTTSRSPR